MKQPVIVAAKNCIWQVRWIFKAFGTRTTTKTFIHYFQAEYPGAMEYLEDVIIGNTVGNGGNIARKSLRSGP